MYFVRQFSNFMPKNNKEMNMETSKTFKVFNQNRWKKPTFRWMLFFIGALFSLGVQAAPTFSTAFSPTTIGPGNVSTLTYTIDNTAESVGASSLSFTNNLPAGIVLATPVNSSTTCLDGNFTAADGGTSVVFTDYRLGAGQSCTLSVDVIGNTVGANTNPAITLSSSSGNDDSTAHDLTVDSGKVGVTLTVDKTSVSVGENVRLTLTFDNSLNGAGVATLDANFTLPSGLEVSDFANVVTDCGSVALGRDITSTQGSTSLSYDIDGSAFGGNHALAAGATCTAALNLKPTTAGVKNIISGDVLGDFTSAGGANTTVTSSLPFLNMSVDAAVAAGATGKLNFTINNFDRSFSATAMSFTLDLDTPLSGLTWNNSTLSGQCGSGILIGSGTGSLSFSGGSLAAEGSCAFSVDLIVPAGVTAGAKTLTASPISVTQNGTTADKNTATADLIITGAPSVALTFVDDTVVAGETATLRVTITDTASENVTDSELLLTLNPPLPFPTTVTLPPTPDPPCGVGSSLTKVFINTDIEGLNLTGGNFLADNSCTFDVDILIPTDVASGDLTFTLTSASSTVSATTVHSPLVSTILGVSGSPTATVEFSEGLKPGSTGTATFTINQDEFNTASNIGFTYNLDTLLSGLTFTITDSNDVCGSGSVFSGTSTITLTGGNLSASETCVFTAQVNVPGGAASGSYSQDLTLNSEINTVATSSTASVVLPVVITDFSMVFAEATGFPLVPGGKTELTFTIDNTASAVDQSITFFTLSLSTFVSGVTSPDTGTTVDTCGGTLSGTTFLTYVGGNVTAGTSCVISVVLDIAPSVDFGNYQFLTSSLSLGGGTSDPAVSALSIVNPLSVTKAFQSDVAYGNGSIDLVYTFDNTSSSSISALSFTDDLDSLLSGMALTGTNSDTCSLAPTGTGTLSVTSGTVPASGSCTLNVTFSIPNTISGQVPITSSSSAFTATVSGIALDHVAASDDFVAAASAQEIVITFDSPSADATFIGNGPITIGVNFANTTGVLLTDSKVSLVGSASADISVSDGTTTTPVVTLNNFTGSGTVAISIDADAANNDAGSSSASISNSAAINIATEPGFSKSFSSDPIFSDEASTLTFTINNTANAFALSDLDFTDNLPSGLTVASPSNASTTCTGGTLTSTSGVSVVSYTGGGLAASSTCTVTVDITSDIAGDYTNTTGDLTSKIDTSASVGNSGTATDTIRVNPQPLFSASFAADPIFEGETSTLTFTVDNSGSTVSVSALDFTDTLPTGLLVGTTPNASTTCTGGTLTATANTSSVNYTGGSVSAGATCTISVDVLGNTEGDYTNSTGSLTSSAGNSDSASDTIRVNAAPLFSKSFVTDPIFVGNATSLTFTIDNSSSTVDANSLAFTDALPAGLEVASPANASTTCSGGTLTAVANAGTVSYSGGSVSTGSSCTLSVDITSSTFGDYVNTTGDLTSSAGNSGTASDTLRVNPVPTFDMSFSQDPIFSGQTSTLTFTVDNTNSTVDVSALDFTNNIPAGLLLATTPNATTSCTGGTLTAAGSTSVVNYTGGTVSAASSCIVSVDITGVAGGSHTNTTGNLTSIAGNSGTATDTIVVNDAPIFSKDFAQDPIFINDVSTLTFTIDNSAGTVDVSTLDFTDNLPVGLEVATTANASTTCTGGTITATANSTSISYSGGSVNSGSTCTVQVDILGTTEGDYTNTSGDLTSSAGNSGSATDTISVWLPLSLTSNVTSPVIGFGNNTRLTFEIMNPRIADVTGLSQTTTLPLGLELASTSIIENTCGIDSTLTAVSGSQVITFSDALISANQTCSYTVLVTSNTIGNYAFNSGVLTSSDGDNVSDGFALTVNTTPTNPTVQITSTVTRTNDTFEAAINFSSAVSGFDINDITVVNGSLANLVTNDNVMFTVDVTPVNEGNTTIDVLANMSLDAELNPNLASNTLAIEIDLTAPVVVITSSDTGLINGQFVTYFTFNEDVSSFSVDDLVVQNATVINFFSHNAREYSATVIPGVDGAINISLPAGVSFDYAGNGNDVSNTFSIEFDGTKPTVVVTSDINVAGASFVASITFDEIVTGFSIEDIVSNNAMLSNLTETSSSVLKSKDILVNNAGSSYTVVVTPITDGLVTLDIAADVAEDAASNGNTAASQFSVNYDATNPTVNITGASGVISTAFTATITFSEDVTGFVQGDITVSNATLSGFSATNAQVYTALVTPSDDGQVTLNVASNVAADPANNGNMPASQFSVNYDATNPTVNITGASGTVNAAFTATITFSEDVTGFVQGDITVSNATLSGFSATSAQVYTALVTPSGDGQVTLDVANNVAEDAANNGNMAAAQFSVNFDGVNPLVVISSTSGAVNAAFTATITFTEDVTGFVITDVIAVNASLSNFNTIDAKTYTVLVTPQAQGNVTLDVPASVALDSSNNGNLAAVQHTVVFDNTSPQLMISGPSDPVSAEFTATLTFNENVTGLTLSDITVTNGVVSNLNSQSGNLYTVTVTPTANGAVTLFVAANLVADSAGNGNSASNTLSVTFDNLILSLVSSTPENGADNIATSVMASFTFNKSIQAVAGNNKLISLFKQGETTPVQSFVALSSDVQVIGATVSLSSSLSLEAGATYTLTITSGSFIDNLANGNDEINITFEVGNTAPVANDDSATVNEGASIEIDILANDTDADNAIDPASVNVVTTPENGTVTIDNVSGKVTYSPNTDFAGADSFMYTVQDITGVVSNAALVTITVTNLNDGPVAVDDLAETDEDTAVIINVLANDTDPDGASDIDASSIVITTNVVNGSTVISNGQVTYTPNENYFGSDSFSYTVNDISGLTSNVANVSISVISVNDAPEFTSTALITANPAEAYSYQFVVTDVDGDTVSVSTSQLPTWLTFDGVDTISGTPLVDDIGKVFNVILNATDEIITQPVIQEFDITINEPGEALLELSQVSSANPVLVGSDIEVTYSIKNTGPEVALLDSLVIELSGTTGLTNLPQNCAVEVINNQDIVTCTLPNELGLDETTQITLTLPTVTGNDEVVSKMTVSKQGSDAMVSNSLIVVIAETLIDQNGDLLTPSSTVSSAFGDLNNDGLADLVIVNRNAETNKVLFNIGAGLFEENQTFGAGSDSRAVKLADFNNDGFLDIVVANTGQTASGYYINDGAGSFGTIIELGQMRSTSVAVGDFNADDLIDIVFGNGKDVGNKVFIQPFNVSIAQEINSSVDSDVVEQTANTTAVISGDFNGDGNIDIVFGYDTSALEIMYNDGAGIFNSEFVDGVQEVNVLKAADINEDGIDDIFISHAMGNGVIYGGTELSDIISISVNPAEDLEVGDVNSDGKLDILILNNPGGISLFNLTDDNQFIRSSAVISTLQSNGIEIADIDGDDDLDIIITSENSTVSDEIRFNQGGGMFGEQTVDLSVSLSTIATAVFEDTYQVTLTVVNDGFANASNPIINYEITSGIVTSIGETSLNCELVSSTSITCNTAVLAPGESASVALSASASIVATANHTVSVISESTDDNSANDSDSSNVIVTEPAKQKSGSGSIHYFVFLMLTCLLMLRRKSLG